MVAALAGHLGAKRALTEGGGSVEPRDLDRVAPEQEYLVPFSAPPPLFNH
jgi:hypothetical protein